VVEGRTKLSTIVTSPTEDDGRVLRGRLFPHRDHGHVGDVLEQDTLSSPPVPVDFPPSLLRIQLNGTSLQQVSSLALAPITWGDSLGLWHRGYVDAIWT